MNVLETRLEGPQGDLVSDDLIFDDLVLMTAALLDFNGQEPIHACASLCSS